MDANLAVEAPSTASLLVAIIGGLVALISGVVAGISSFLTSNRQGRATVEAAQAQADALIKTAQEQAAAAVAAAQHASGADAFVPASARHAEWQMHKRKLYEDVLQGLNTHVATRSDNRQLALQNAVNRALLVAGPKLRLKLHELWENAEQAEGAVDRVDLVNLMVLDVEAKD